MHSACITNSKFPSFLSPKVPLKTLNSNLPSLSGFATGMANFTLDVHLGMIVIFDNLETEWIVIYRTIW